MGKSIDMNEEIRALYWDSNLEVLTAVTRAVNQSLNLQDIYRVALDKVIELRNVDIAFIYLVDETKKEAVLQDHRNLPGEYIRRADRIPYPEGVTWKVINTGEILSVKNAQADPGVGPMGRDLGPRGRLGIPIVFEGAVIGVIWFLSCRGHFFTRAEEELLTSIGTQIAMAIAKAKLYGELSKKNRYETIISTVTRSVHQSIGLQDVLENAVEALSRNIDTVNSTGIYLVEGDEAVLKAHRNVPDTFIKRAGRIPRPKGYIWRTIIEGTPIYCADVDRDIVIGLAGREMGIKSYLGMPIYSEGKTAGVISINSLKRDAFDEEELKLLEVVTQQIEIAINNANRAEALRVSEERYRSLIETAPEVIFTLSTDGTITSLSPAFEKITGWPAAQWVGKPFPLIIHSDDLPLATEKFYGVLNGVILSPFELRVLSQSGEYIFGEFVGTPLIKDGEAVGVLGIARDITERKRAEEILRKAHEVLRKAHDELEIKVQERTAELLEINKKLRNEIAERKRAVDTLRETAERLQTLSQVMAEVQETERRRWVEVLHDNVGQNLSAISINLNIMRNLLSPESAAKADSRLEDSLRLMEEATVRIRDVMTELYPPVLSDYGLLATLRWFGEVTAARTGLEITVEGEEPIPRLLLEIETALFRIVQEAVNNVIKHAFPSRIRIKLQSNPSQVRLTISDDGVGFDPSTYADKARQSWGLLIMRGRADAMGGRLHVKSAPGQGTEVVVEVER